nr:type II toxin-antitoxin system YoeB family toxin [uncultured Acetatifactor sp.]
MSEKIWSDDAWEDYLYWQTQDKKTLKRINQLIQRLARLPYGEWAALHRPLQRPLRRYTA